MEQITRHHRNFKSFSIQSTDKALWIDGSNFPCDLALNFSGQKCGESELFGQLIKKGSVILWEAKKQAAKEKTEEAIARILKKGLRPGLFMPSPA